MAVIPLVAGVALDAVLPEPPSAWHPVARFGSLMAAVERQVYRDERRAGVLYMGVGVGVALAAGLAANRLLGRPAATGLAVLVCSAGAMLDREAAITAERLRLGDLDGARERVMSLVGRDPEELDAAGISRAVVESVAENSVDAVTATLWWAAMAGAPGVLVHRAVNTLDAMVGYRNERYRNFGWAAARADDLLNVVPARLSMPAVILARPTRAADIARTVRRDAARHPSPNGGIVEAAFAAALGLRLGGVNRYGHRAEDRGHLGDGRPPEPADIDDAIRLRRHSTVATLALVLILPMTRRILPMARRTGSRSRA